MLARRGLRSAKFDHPAFSTDPESLKTASYFEAETVEGLSLKFTGTNWWAAQASSLPTGWKPERRQVRLGEYHLRQWLRKSRGLRLHPRGRHQHHESIDGICLELPRYRSRGYHSMLSFPAPAPDDPRLFVITDHAMAAYRLAGERGYWQLSLLREDGMALPQQSALVLRDEIDDEIIGFVKVVELA